MFSETGRRSSSPCASPSWNWTYILNYLLVMFNNLEIIGNFMHAQNAYLPLRALLRPGQLDMSPITPKVFSLLNLTRATMQYAGEADSLEMIVVTSMNSRN